ncbi:exodeoxyribonuclease V subunit alpha [Pseudomonadota bacterium]|nr:exodeoxyribonuclease V subunit alpha [Pseudomonadota bacterium]
MSDVKPANVARLLRQAGFSELACQFAAYIERVESGDDNVVAITAGLLTEAVAQGHVCLNLMRMDSTYQSVNHYLPEQLDAWKRRLKNSNVVGTADDYRPLIIGDDGSLYLYRHWHDEQNVAKAISVRNQSIELVDLEALKQDMKVWPKSVEGIDWQKVAVLMALTRQFCVISGGPGTGKTTVVLRMLQCLHHQNKQHRIALAAPTGKAAARLQHVISDKDNATIQAQTLHRLLGISPSNEQGRYNAQRTLPFDVVIVDEASMVDISLMAKLFKALAPATRLILLGDSQQLASVESGAVLANLCQYPMTFNDDFIAIAEQSAELDLSEYLTSDVTVMSNNVVKLQHSYRFDQHSVIGRLAYAVQSGDSKRVISELVQAGDVWEQSEDAQFIEGYQAYFNTVNSGADALTCIHQFEQYRVLCATKKGPQSVMTVNWAIKHHVAKMGWRSQQDFYHGRAIMINQNDYRQQLFNGDTGLILKDETGQLRACFLIDNALRWVDLIRLPAHETAFAITIHKSQGSEFEQVCIVLPQEDTAILNRELLYTAITRAKNKVMLLANDAIVRKTVITQHQRESGLVGLLK